MTEVEVLQRRDMALGESGPLSGAGGCAGESLRGIPLNGDSHFYKNKEDSISISSDAEYQLEDILKQAEKINLNIIPPTNNEKQKPKKQVHFNMAKNEQYVYEYCCNSEVSESEDDGESMLHNGQVHFLDDDLGSEEDYSMDDYDESEEETEESGNESDQTSNTSSEQESLRTHTYDRTADITAQQNDIKDSSVDINFNKLTPSQELEYLTQKDQEAKVNLSESTLRERQNSVNKQLTDMSELVKRVRQQTREEIDKLNGELEGRRRAYKTEMDDLARQRDHQRNKLKEELHELEEGMNLEERREKYKRLETEITKKEEDLEKRRVQAYEQEQEILEYEEYLDRRQQMCNSKNEDIKVLDQELDTLEKELLKKKSELRKEEKTLNKALGLDTAKEHDPEADEEDGMRESKWHRVVQRVHRNKFETEAAVLKAQNQQLEDELFQLRKSLEEREEELADIHEKLTESENEKKKMKQKVKHMESQLTFALKTSELESSHDKEWFHSGSIDKSRVPVKSLSFSPETSGSLRSPPPSPLKRLNSSDSTTNSSDSGLYSHHFANSKESPTHEQKHLTDDSPGKKHGRHKVDTRRVISAMCVVM